MAPTHIPAEHDLLIPAPQRVFALRLLDRWVDSHLFAATLPEGILQADRVAQIGGLLTGAPVSTHPFVSRAAEQTLFAGLCGRLAEQSGRDLLETLASLVPTLEQHAQGF